MRKKIDDFEEIVRERPGIGEYAESALHRALKRMYAGKNGRVEVSYDGKVVDCVTEDGIFVEIQTAAFGSIKEKILAIAKTREIILVHPIYVKKNIVTIEKTGEIRSERKSPKKETIFNMFDELVYAPSFIARKNLSLDFCLVHVREIRIDDGKGSWRKKGISPLERELVEVLEIRKFRSKRDYRKLIPFKKGETFTNKALSAVLSIPRDVAGKMTNCLKKSGIIKEEGKSGRELLFTL